MSKTADTYTTNLPLKVALLYGGISNERDISIASGEGMKKEIEAVGHEVVMIDTGQPGFIEKIASCNADAAFISLHGEGGEDGTIQGVLELMGIPYVGCGVGASAIALDKMRSKLLFEAAGLMTPAAALLSAKDFFALALAETLRAPQDTSAPTSFDELFKQAYNAEDYGEEFIEILSEEIGLPCIVKPSKGGSSFGVSIVRSPKEFRTALLTGFEVEEELLIEAFIEGIEVTVALIGNDEIEVLPIIEIVPTNEFYDFESKYTEGGSLHIIPARITEDEMLACQEAAYMAHEIIGCRGMSRVDIIVSKDGTPWVIEINTIPGMTPTSLLPDAARAAGISMGELCDSLLMWALETKPLGMRANLQDNL